MRFGLAQSTATPHRANHGVAEESLDGPQREQTPATGTSVQSRRRNLPRSTQRRSRHTALQPQPQPQDRCVPNHCDQLRMFAEQAHGIHRLLAACWLSKA
jgi:hypothetical protein